MMTNGRFKRPFRCSGVCMKKLLATSVAVLSANSKATMCFPFKPEMVRMDAGSRTA